MTDRKQWGGKRPNQTGRPKIEEKDKRISIHARVSPETNKFLRKHKKSMGKAIDEAVHFQIEKNEN